MKMAVTTVLSARTGTTTATSRRMCSAHLVEPVACTPGAGWEKGQVEKQVGDVPRPPVRAHPERPVLCRDQRVSDGSLHHRALRARGARRRQEAAAPDDPGKTVWQVFQEERPFLMAYRGPFEASMRRSVGVQDMPGALRHNQYSVEARAVGQPVDVRAYADRIVIRQDGETVAEHSRSFGRGKIVYEPWHLRADPAAQAGRIA